jgi:hypothetical protein
MRVESNGEKLLLHEKILLSVMPAKAGLTELYKALYQTAA